MTTSTIGLFFAALLALGSAVGAAGEAGPDSSIKITSADETAYLISFRGVVIGKAERSMKHAGSGDAARLYRRRVRQLLEAIGITIGAHIFFVGAVWMLGLSLGIAGIPWYSYFVYVPLIYIIGAIPITPGGVGLIEQLYVTYFVSVEGGVNASVVLAMALLARLIPILLGLPGALVAVTGPRLPKTEAMRQELSVEADAPASDA